MKPDWEAIQRAYETTGLSLRDLAASYGISHTTLYARSRKWFRTEQSNTSNNEQKIEQPLRLVRSEFPSPPSAIEGANLGLVALVDYLKTRTKEMDLADHVKAANALSQYNKIIINAPPEEQDAEHEDLSMFNEDELKLYAELQERAAKRA